VNGRAFTVTRKVKVSKPPLVFFGCLTSDFVVAPSQATIYRDMFKAEMKEREKLDALSTAGTPFTICLDTALKIQSKQWVMFVILFTLMN
jgi:hypothetical protein